MNSGIQLVQRRTLLHLIGLAALFPLTVLAHTPNQKLIRYVCTNPDCLPYIYDPTLGDPNQGIAPSTAWGDVPETGWTCPICGDPKNNFRRYS